MEEIVAASKSVKYRVINDRISFEPVDRDGNPMTEHWKYFHEGDTFMYPSDVSCPAGNVINLEFLIGKGAVEEVGKVEEVVVEVMREVSESLDDSDALSSDG